jgi:hypothetical protein
MQLFCVDRAAGPGVEGSEGQLPLLRGATFGGTPEIGRTTAEQENRSSSPAAEFSIFLDTKLSCDLPSRL